MVSLLSLAHHPRHLDIRVVAFSPPIRVSLCIICVLCAWVCVCVCVCVFAMLSS